ncbi:MAG: hypothetical protein HQK65_20740 [Desulfamplus sp.]|nr:hypothetical protein [Desulfamplus sp.]
MLSIFDWIRRSRNGAELLATLEYFKEHKPDLFPEEKAVAGPLTFLERPCDRCWIYPSRADQKEIYCKTCQQIVMISKTRGYKSRHAVVVWGYVNQLPKYLESGKGFYSSNILGSYVHDENHFMLILERYKVKPWVQELLLYHGAELKGLLQIFPTIPDTKRGNMNDIINRAVHQDSRYPMAHLRIRFFSNAFQIFVPHKRDDAGLLTFEVREFLELLQMAFIFRSLLRPEDQQLLRELIDIDNITDRRFQWARFAGSLHPEARDMLNSWNIPLWPENKITLLYELLDYVEYSLN